MASRAGVALLGALVFTEPVLAIPVNPERPLSERTCKEAEKRLREAETGSPLVSKQENLKILELARKTAEQLCGDAK